MDILNQYLSINKALWNAKTEHHVSSDFYRMEAFVKGATSLNDIELNLLGDVHGKKILHLQCHFGQDSLSLARMGAKVTGVDFSDAAIDIARGLNAQLKLDANFVCCDIYSLPGVLVDAFDIVFTSYGTIGWLPDLTKWAAVVSRYVKPGGRFIMADFHPVMWMMSNDFSSIQYSYFNREAIIETLEGTYANRDADIKQTEIGWNHNLAEILQNLIESGLTINALREYDTSPYNCFNKMVEVTPGGFQIEGLEGKLPIVYAIEAVNNKV